MEKELKILTLEEKKQKVRDYLQKYTQKNNLEKCSFFDIMLNTNISEPDLILVLNHLEVEKVITRKIAEFDIYFLKIEESKKRLCDLRSQDKLRSWFHDSQKIISSIALVAFIFFTSTIFFPSKINSLFDGESSSFLLFAFTYLFLILTVMIAVLMKSISEWFQFMGRKRIFKLIFFLLGIIILFGMILTLFSKNWNIFSALLALGAALSSIFQDKIRDFIHSLYKKTKK